jgi:hypothetical protein
MAAVSSSVQSIKPPMHKSTDSDAASVSGGCSGVFGGDGLGGGKLSGGGGDAIGAKGGEGGGGGSGGGGSGGGSGGGITVRRVRR